jgi:hypothetical protein
MTMNGNNPHSGAPISWKTCLAAVADVGQQRTRAGKERGAAARPCGVVADIAPIAPFAAVGRALIGPPPRSRQGRRGQIVLAGAFAQQLLVVWSSRAPSRISSR